MFGLLAGTAFDFTLVVLLLLLSLTAARRALLSCGPNSVIYIIFSGYTAIAGLTSLVWTVFQDAPSFAVLAMTSVCIGAWILINRQLQRPIYGYRDMRSSKEQRAQRPNRHHVRKAQEVKVVDAAGLDLPFLPSTAGRRLQ